MNHAKRIPPGSQRGVSLIELMVAMAIGLILVATIANAYLAAKEGFHTLSTLSRIQEGARYAFEFMGSDIRMAGFTGGPSSGGTNVVSDPTSGWDANLKHLYSNETGTSGAPLIGLDDTNPTDVCTTANTSPCYRQGDTLTVVRADNENEFALDATVGGNCSGTADCVLDAWPASGAPAAGEIMVAADYTHSATFQVSAASSGTRTVAHATGTVTPGNSSADLGTFYAAIDARKLYRLRGVTYYIGTNPVGEPALYRRRLGHTGTSASASTEELVEGVEDMQIKYGIDTDATADGAVDCYWSADNVTSGGPANCPDDDAAGTSTSLPGANAQERWARVLGVRVTLTMISRRGETITTTGDGLLRKTITNTIAVRNRL